MTTRVRIVSGVTALAVGLSITAVGLAGASAGSSPGSLTFDEPSSPVAGPVSLTGTVGAGPGEVTSVLYVLDATGSTAGPTGADCSGDGGVGPADDLNNDGSVGDVLDCEIAGVTAFNDSLATTNGHRVGLVAFANAAAAADVVPGPAAGSWVEPGFTGGDPQPRIRTVASSVVRNEIGLYTSKGLGGSGAGTAFNSAIQTSLATLSAAPAGPKWIIFLSDGQSPVDDSLLTQLAGSGIRLRSFGIGQDASCAKHGSLYKMASATGESCVVVGSPATLSAGLTGSEPDSVNGVTVSINGISVAADIDPLGGWRAAFFLGSGRYTAVARAVLASGSTMTKRRTFTVASSPGGPPPGSIAPGQGALFATAIEVTRPPATRTVTPPRVTGRVGGPGKHVQTIRRLKGAKVLLQARKTAGDPWTTVDRDKVDRRGAFRLAWKPQARLPLLRVALLPYKDYAGSAAAVPAPPISSCTVRRRGGGWTVKCLTTARNGSVARLLDGSRVLDRGRVTKGTLRLHGTGAVAKRIVDVTVHGRHVKLVL